MDPVYLPFALHALHRLSQWRWHCLAIVGVCYWLLQAAAVWAVCVCLNVQPARLVPVCCTARLLALMLLTGV